MKTKLESISDARGLVVDLKSAAETSIVQLAQAKTALECSSPERCKSILTAARSHLVKLHRTQLHALRNIDDALKSLSS